MKIHINSTNTVNNFDIFIFTQLIIAFYALNVIMLIYQIEVHSVNI